MSKINTFLVHFKKRYGKEVFIFFILSFIFHMLAVFFSEGFHRPDEHLGIMRFVGHKLGILSPGEALSSWEYPAKIRPWLQPYLYYLLTIIPYKLGLTDPFILTFLMRFFSSLLGYFSHLYFFTSASRFIKSKQALLFFSFAISLLWFLPFFHARTNAENVATSFFLIGTSLLIRHLSSLEERQSHFSGSIRTIIIISFFWALSFIFRYQMIAFSGPIIIWILFRVKNKKNLLIYGIGTFLIIQLLSIPIDFLGYQEWTFAPWNYFRENIINDKASQFGTDPFWYYIPKVIGRGIPPLSLLILIPTVWMFIKRPFHLISFSGLSFLIIHSLTGHKEIRFIFPLAPFAAFYGGQFIDYFKKWKCPAWIWKFFIFQSFVALLLSSLKPAHNPIKFYKHLYYHQEQMSKIYTLNVIRDQLFFYQNRKVEFKHIKDTTEVSKDSFWILTDRVQAKEKITLAHKCHVDYSSYPEWVIKQLRKVSKKSKVWTLLKCQKNKGPSTPTK